MSHSTLVHSTLLVQYLRECAARPTTRADSRSLGTASKLWSPVFALPRLRPRIASKFADEVAKGGSRKPGEQKAIFT